MNELQRHIYSWTFFFFFFPYHQINCYLYVVHVNPTNPLAHTTWHCTLLLSKIQSLLFTGDGQEQKDEKVDDDEDRRNPQYIPKKGMFYEHDDRIDSGDKKRPKKED